jgi:hypothetical protein
MTTRIRIPSLAPRDRRALLIGAALVLPVLLTVFVAMPWVRHAALQRAATDRERTLLARERALVAGARRDADLLAQARRSLAEAAPRLFGGSEAVTASAELARYVDALATDNGLVIDRTESVLDDRAEAPDDGDRTRSRARADSLDGALRVTIQAHGDAQSIVDFLRSGENGPRDIRFERVGIVRGQEATRPAASAGALSITATVTGLARFALLGAPHDGLEPAGATRSAQGRTDERASSDLVLANDPFDPERATVVAAADEPREAPRDTAPATPAVAVRLLGTVVRGGDSFALCQIQPEPPRIVRVGERLGDLVLLAIDQGRAVFRSRTGTRVELSLTTPGA